MLSVRRRLGAQGLTTQGSGLALQNVNGQRISVPSICNTRSGRATRGARSRRGRRFQRRRIRGTSRGWGWRPDVHERRGRMRGAARSRQYDAFNRDGRERRVERARGVDLRSWLGPAGDTPSTRSTMPTIAASTGVPRSASRRRRPSVETIRLSRSRRRPPCRWPAAPAPEARRRRRPAGRASTWRPRTRVLLRGDQRADDEGRVAFGDGSGR